LGLGLAGWGGVAVPIVSSVPSAGHALALTFDDGPSENTVGLLDVLGRNGARATFFVLGSAIERHPELLRAATAAGHEVANHSWSHPHFAELSDEEIRDELVRTAVLATAETGVRPRVLRCPYGSGEERVAQLADSVALGDAVVHWSVDPEDWSSPPPATIVERVLADVHPGAIVCLHDGPGRENTVEALATLVPVLVADGYALVTVSELLESAPNREVRR
jgi:peptidoglycan/xylan/chitin deacetylase (PgdA/CDA1 family)